METLIISIVQQANKEWQGDYSMISYKIKQQCKALYEFFNMEKPIKMTENTFSTIRLTALNEWGELELNSTRVAKVDWVMVLYETKNQIEAYFEIF